MTLPNESPTLVRPIETLFGPDGRLEAILNGGRDDAPYSALLCHPYPLAGGTMHNKVVYHAMKVFSALGVPVLRFNFRGVGLSEGKFDYGDGEQNDVHAALNWLEQNFKRPILFAGFSFGAYVGFRACCGDVRVKGLIALGLPVEAAGRKYSYDFLTKCAAPKLFINGDHDPIGPPELVERILENAPEPKHKVWIEGAGHFFQGIPGSPDPKLAVMQRELRGWLEKQFRLA